MSKESFEAMYGIDGPKWKDGCNHPEGSYVCSYSLVVMTGGTPDHEEIDMYVYPDESWPGSKQSVCLRYGNSPEEYLSPGPIVNVIAVAGDSETYRIAGRALQTYGKIVWERETASTSHSLEERMRISKDTKKGFHYSKCNGQWYWTEGNDTTPLAWENRQGPFKTFEEALNDAVGPYLEDSEDGANVCIPEHRSEPEGE